MFVANTVNSRDIGLAILSDENKYRFNYAIGVFNGMGQNLTDEGAAVSQRVPVEGSESARTYNWNTRVKNGEVMLVARLLWKISGNPGYGEGDIQYSRKPQTALAVGYAYNPGVNVLSSIRSDIVARGIRDADGQGGEWAVFGRRHL